MHVILWQGSECRKQPAAAIFTNCLEHMENLKNKRKKTGLVLSAAEQKKDRTKYVRRFIGEWHVVCAKIMMIVEANIAVDIETRKECICTGKPTENVIVADLAYPLIAKKVKKAVMNQLVHVLNVCLEDEGCMSVCTGTTNYRNTET